MLNKYREISYVDDGVTSYECLRCHKGWDTRSMHNWAFCPFCGSKWEGQHKYPEKKRYYPKETPRLRTHQWQIQSRIVWTKEDKVLYEPDDLHEEWEAAYLHGCGSKSPTDFNTYEQYLRYITLFKLKQAREDQRNDNEIFKREFRIVRIEVDYSSYPHKEQVVSILDI